MNKKMVTIKNKNGKIFLIKIGMINHYHQSFVLPIFAYEHRPKIFTKLIPFDDEIGRLMINVNDPAAEIIEFKVREKFRDQGLGRLMLELGKCILQEETSTQEITAVPISEPYPNESCVSVSDLVNMYRKFGFHLCPKNNTSNTEKMKLKF